jgi:hypothetical protein
MDVLGSGSLKADSYPAKNEVLYLFSTICFDLFVSVVNSVRELLLAFSSDEGKRGDRGGRGGRGKSSVLVFSAVLRNRNYRKGNCLP